MTVLFPKARYCRSHQFALNYYQTKYEERVIRALDKRGIRGLAKKEHLMIILG